MKLFSLPLIVFVFLTFGVTSIFGQDLSKECESIYGEYVANRKGPEIEKFEKAIRFGKL